MTALGQELGEQLGCLVEVSPTTRIASHVWKTAGTGVDMIARAKRTEAGPLMEGSRRGAWRTEIGTRRRGRVPNHLRWLGISKLLVLLFVLPVAAEPHEPGYADAKIASPARTSRAGVRLAFPADELPRRGMLVATGNALSPLARWIV
ncbi:MAG: hypothetical protein EOO77_36445, partial [Oxalobacteraceae bacterium]